MNDEEQRKLTASLGLDMVKKRDQYILEALLAETATADDNAMKIDALRDTINILASAQPAVASGDSYARKMTSIAASKEVSARWESEMEKLSKVISTPIKEEKVKPTYGFQKTLIKSTKKG